MLANETSSVSALPQEIHNLILHQVNDDSFLWVVCRQVSHAYRKEVEFMFRTSLLEEVLVKWSGDIHYSGLRYYCRFSSVSEDKQTAYFAMQPITEDLKIPPRNHPHLDRSLERFEELVVRYLDESDGRSRHNGLLFRTVVIRIGLQTNNTRVTDVAIPGLQFDPFVPGISFKWIDLFTNFYQEEHLIATRKAAHGITSAPLIRFPTVYPVLVPKEYFDRALDPSGHDDFPIRLTVRARRFLKILEGKGQEPDEDFFDAVASDLRHFLLLESCIRMNELRFRRHLQRGEVGQQLYWVEDPESNGWKRWTRKQTGTRGEWYNYGLEDPEWGGLVTLSDDPLVLEVERMAYGWEKALYYAVFP